jgi:hypothetical protein
MHSPSEEDMDVVYQILQYLKNASGKGLLFYKLVLPTLKAIQILIGQVIKQLEGLYLDILHLWRVSLSLGEAKCCGTIKCIS